MKSVGIFEAKTHFSALIDDVQRGSAVTVTKNGKPVARIVPIAEDEPRDLGFDDGKGQVPNDFNAPLPADVLALFYGK